MKARPMQIHLSEPMKHTFDVLSVGTVLGTLAGMLPHIAAVVSIVWGCIRIYETKTVQGWLGREVKPGLTE
jgi:hypothetical protein